MAGRGSRHGVTLDNWQRQPWSTWGFSHVSELVTSATISRHVRGTADVGAAAATGAVSDELDAFLLETDTRALVVRRDGRPVLEWYADDFGRSGHHLLMSVSKSVCALVVGRLVGDGLLAPGQHVRHYLPALAESAFGDATIQQLLDMQVAVEYSEDYHDPAAHVDQQDRIAGWAPRRPEDPLDVFAFLAGLRRNGQHGRYFQYCSAVTDVLAWLVEIVTSQTYAEVVSGELWSRLNCEDDALVTVDSSGFAFANGGMACTARDLSRVGQLLLDGGAVGDDQVVPQSWIAATLAGCDPVTAAGSVFQQVHPGGSYRNQWWSTGDATGSVYAAGIHGQYIWVDPAEQVVITKFSAQADAVSQVSSRRHADAFGRIARGELD